MVANKYSVYHAKGSKYGENLKPVLDCDPRQAQN